MKLDCLINELVLRRLIGRIGGDRNIFEKLLIDKCKHSPHLEFESLVLKKVKNFLTQIN